MSALALEANKRLRTNANPGHGGEWKSPFFFRGGGWGWCLVFLAETQSFAETQSGLVILHRHPELASG